MLNFFAFVRHALLQRITGKTTIPLITGQLFILEIYTFLYR